MKALAAIPLHDATFIGHPPALTGEHVPVIFAGVQIGTGVVTKYVWNAAFGHWVAHIEIDTKEDPCLDPSE